MKRKRFKSIVGILGAILCMGWPSSAFASNCTYVGNVQISPAAPSPGDTVTLTWDYQMDSAYNHPFAMAVVSDQCAFRPGNTGGQYVVLGNGCLPSAGQVSGGCDMGTNLPVGTNTGSKTITIPTGLTPGTTYYVAVAMRDYGVYANPGLGLDQQACTSFTIPLPAPYIKLNKIAEGTSASPGGKVLYTIYYDFSNVNNVTITDVVDPQMSVVAVYDGGTPSGNTITWSFPGFTGAPKKGFVSFLAQVGGGVANNTIIPNVATATSAEVSASSNNAIVTVAGVGLALAKSVTPSAAVAGNTLTYTLAYTASGQSLWEYENFNAGVVPAGWVNMPDGATNATWSAAGGYLHSIGSLGSFYPGIKDTNMAPIHDAVYTYDTQVRSDSNFFDSVFRFNIDPANDNNFYMAVLETDNQWLNIYKQPGHTSVCLVNNPNGLTLQSDTWYTVKIEVICNLFKVKVWLRDSTEPAAWSVTGTDSSYSSGGLVGFQVDNGPSYYDNLKIFSLQGGTNVRVWDSVPAGTTYLAGSCTGGSGCSESGGVITWPVGGACSNSGTLTFKTTVNAGYSCGQMVSNTAKIDSDDPPPAVDSNTVGTSLLGFCNTPTPSPTPTATRTASPSPSATPSITLTRTSTATPSLTFTASPPFTNTASPSITPTYTATPSASPSSTATGTYTATPSASPSSTATGTYTATPSPSPSRTNSPQYTPTVTPTVTPTASPSPTYTATPSASPSPTPTASFSPSPTLTDSATASPSASVTPTFTISPTITVTRTPVEKGPLLEIRGIYPTPFDEVCNIYYFLRKPATLKVTVFNVAGEPVHGWDFSVATPGKRLLEWKGDNDGGGRCASGAYILRIATEADDGETDLDWGRLAVAR